MAKSKANQQPTVDYEAYFAVPVPGDVVYMHNVLQTFIHAIPQECRKHCSSEKHPDVDAVMSVEDMQIALRDYVEERLSKLADYEYRGWVNGQQPFVTPRELQIWRLRLFVQHIWFWNLPDDEDLALIFNLTKRRATNLASDFIARFRKTIIYPVALRRLYFLINRSEPELEKVEHPSGKALGHVFRIPTTRFVGAARSLADDIRSDSNVTMANPYLWDKEQYRMWVDVEMVDVMKTDDDLRKRLYKMYEISKL